MDEILDEFRNESKGLVSEMLEILEEVEGQFDHRFLLENFGQVVDRIMGGAKNLELAYEENENIRKIAKYSELCKLVGYKTSQIDNPDLFTVSVALLLDATEMLDDLVEKFGTDKEIDVSQILSSTFLDRLSWVAGKFDENLRASVAVNKDKKDGKSQDQIDDLLKSLGILG